MRSFSPSAAAFEGFRIIRANPASFLAWTGVLLLMQLAVAGVLATTLGPHMADLAPYTAAGTTMPPAVAMKSMGSFFGAFLVMFPVIMAFMSVFLGGVFRRVLRPADKGLFFLRLGGDELRLFLLQLAWLGLGLLAELAAIVVFTVVIGVGAAVGAAGKNAGAGLMLVPFLVLALFCFWVWVFVRLSLAAPMTFAEKRVRVFASWGLTKGQFWSLFGCYLLAAIFAVLVMLIGFAVSTLVVFVTFGSSAAMSSLTMAPGSAMAVFARMFTAAGIVRLVISVLFSAVAYVVVSGAMAEAYRSLTFKAEDGGIWD